MGLFSSKKNTVTQEAMLTDEQKEAMRMLSSLSKTGKFGGINLGEGYGESLGEFKKSDLEGQSQNRIKAMLESGSPEMLNLAKDEIKGLLTGQFDPNDPKGIYSGFKKETLRSAGEQSDALKRRLAVTGDLYSTAHVREQGDLAERTHDNLTNSLAGLYDRYADRRLQGAQTAGNLGISEQGLELDRIGAASESGSLTRMLKDAEAKSKYAEWQRGRSEKMGQIDAAKTVLAKQVPYGVKEFTSESPSVFSNLLNTGLSAASKSFGGSMGNMFSDKLGSMFKKKTPSVNDYGVGIGLNPGGFLR